MNPGLELIMTVTMIVLFTSLMLFHGAMTIITG